MAFLNGMKRLCPDMNWLEMADESCQWADGRKTVVSCGDAAVTGDLIGAKERDEVGRDVDDCKTVDRGCIAAKGITWQSASRQPCWVLRARLAVGDDVLEQEAPTPGARESFVIPQLDAALDADRSGSRRLVRGRRRGRPASERESRPRVEFGRDPPASSECVHNTSSSQRTGRPNPHPRSRCSCAIVARWRGQCYGRSGILSVLDSHYNPRATRRLVAAAATVP
jgi:hypothetical protein